MIKYKRKFKINPALQIVLGFLTLILVGTFFLCLPISSADGQWISFVDGIFTSTSAVSTSGLIVFDTAVHFSLFGQIVILVLMQIGGIGVICLTTLVFLILGKKIKYKSRLALQEGLNQESNQGVVKMIRKIVIFTFAIEVVGFLILLIPFVPKYGWGNGIFKSIFITVSAFCNAGFDIMGTPENPFVNLADFQTNPLVLFVVMILVIIGGFGFLVIFDVLDFKKKKSFHAKVVLIVSAVLIVLGAIVFTVLEWNNPATFGGLGWFDKITNGLFASVMPRSTGFSTFNYANLTSGSVLFTNILMFIGAGPASTAGGIRVTTLFVLLVAMFKGTNKNGDLVVFKKTITASAIRKALRVFALSLLLCITSTFLLCVSHNNITVSEAIFESISAFSSAGLSLGITPYLNIFGKLVITMVMFIGRVGIFTFTIAFANRIKTDDEIEYPDSKIVIG